MKKTFEQLSHTADIKIRVYGHTISDFFRHAVMGMFQSIGPVASTASGCKKEGDLLICPDLDKKHTIAITAIDLESLLVDFLSEVLYLSDVHNEAYLDAIIDSVDHTSIQATVLGIGVTGFEVVEIKAVTYHGLEIKQIDGVWQADIVFDI